LALDLTKVLALDFYLALAKALDLAIMLVSAKDSYLDLVKVLDLESY
jgi:hypothetical protein